MDLKSNKPVKWTVSVPETLDIAVRHHLVQEGLRKGDLSAFVVEALQAWLCAQNLAAIRSRNADVPADALRSAVAEAVAAVRAETFRARA